MEPITDVDKLKVRNPITLLISFYIFDIILFDA